MRWLVEWPTGNAAPAKDWAVQPVREHPVTLVSVAHGFLTLERLRPNLVASV